MIFFSAEALDDLDQAVEWYEKQKIGLGVAFQEEVARTIDKIESYPLSHPAILDDIRRCRTHRFPYGIVYKINATSLTVIAVMHLHRDPDYWKQRI